MDGLIAGLAATFVLNIPFGYWRAHAKARGNRREWFIAIHAPVPLVILFRVLAGAGIREIPAFIVAFFLGQLMGGRIYKRVSSMVDTSRCMPCDLLKIYKGAGK